VYKTGKEALICTKMLTLRLFYAIGYRLWAAGCFYAIGYRLFYAVRYRLLATGCFYAVAYLYSEKPTAKSRQTTASPIF